MSSPSATGSSCRNWGGGSPIRSAMRPLPPVIARPNVLLSSATGPLPWCGTAEEPGMKRIRPTLLALIGVGLLAGRVWSMEGYIPPDSMPNDPLVKAWKAPFGIEFVRVPGGCFQMGSNDGEADEKPVHEVCVDGFEMGKYEVTQKQWRAVMGSDPPELNFKGCDDCPVERVSWLQVQEFIGKLNGGRSGPYRLPSEAEWEYACRGGRSGETYCGGNDIDRVAWHGGNSEGKTHPVGRKAANGFGLHDMSGNVWERVSDWYGYYANSPRNNPKGPDRGFDRVERGGGWFLNALSVRSAYRSRSDPGYRGLDLGFRLSRTGP
ncbi:MAG: formylglycine-generating enzyme family protein [Magnetococcales bacterium]|nr:formylglycine-generating enzyme family protein [Magnetococcales bacterium]